MKLIRIIDRTLGLIEWGLLVLILLTIVGVGALQVILRNFFHTGIEWADVFLRHLVLWLGLIGAITATSRDRHLNIDALVRILPPLWKEITGIFVKIFAILFCFLLFLAGKDFIKSTMSLGGNEPIFLGIPLWIVQLIIPITFLLIGVRFIIKIIESVYTLVTKESLPCEYYKNQKTGPLTSDTGPLLTRNTAPLKLLNVNLVEEKTNINNELEK